jgi:hypothetical protein
MLEKAQKQFAIRASFFSAYSCRPGRCFMVLMVLKTRIPAFFHVPHLNVTPVSGSSSPLRQTEPAKLDSNSFSHPWA